MELLLLSVLGGLLALDGTSVGQFMVSRPLVAGALAGAVLGAPAEGFAVGALLEVYLLVAFPVGGVRFPEGATATVVAVAATIPTTPGTLAIGVAAGLVWGQIGGASVSLLRRANERIVPDPEAATVGRVEAAQAAAIALDFLRGVAVTGVGVWLAEAAALGLAPAWPLDMAATRAFLLLGAVVSIGILVRDLGSRRGTLRRRILPLALGLSAGLTLGWAL